jgi:hypothetical protein
MNDYGLKAKVLNEARRQTLNKFKELGVTPAYIVISGSHLYGFPSKDSDLDVRCCHIRDTKDLFHLDKNGDVLEWKSEIDGILTEFVSLEIEKDIRLCMENNSNILEHLSAKNLLTTESVECTKLREIAFKGISKKIAKPYEGMARQNYRKFIESMNPTYEDKLVKKYLYVMRSYIVGMHALRTGEVIPNIQHHFEELEKPLVETIDYLL